MRKEVMARIVIKDLHENTELDRKAMQNIRGGARGVIGAGYTARARVQRPRISPARLFSNNK